MSGGRRRLDIKNYFLCAGAACGYIKILMHSKAGERLKVAVGWEACIYMTEM